MKDVTHHRLHVQRKVMQSLRKEMEKEEAKSLKDGEGLNGSLTLNVIPKKSNVRRRTLRAPS